MALKTPRQKNVLPVGVLCVSHDESENVSGETAPITLHENEKWAEKGKKKNEVS